MTVARFDGEGVDAQTQALACFWRLRDFVYGMGQRIDAASYLVVEVNRRDSLASVMKARSSVFGDRRPKVVSNRYATLPPGELVRVTVEFDNARRDPDPR
jgi:hypothetical protein